MKYTEKRKEEAQKWYLKLKKDPVRYKRYLTNVNKSHTKYREIKHDAVKKKLIEAGLERYVSVYEAEVQKRKDEFGKRFKKHGI